jgi:hypothetical protein
MLRGHRCIVIAAFGWLSLSASPPKQGAQRDKPASQSASQSDLKRIATALEQLPQAQTPDRGCEAGQDKRDSDLCAQWKAADGAAASAIWTERAFWLGFAGLAVGGLTLFFASRAAHWAKEAARHTETGSKAATDALGLARQAAAVQLRPYVYVTDEKIRFTERDDIAEATVYFQNFGEIPAINVQLSVRTFIAVYDKLGADLPAGDFEQTSYGDMPKGLQNHADPIYIMGIFANQHDIRRGESAIFVDGFISYTDATRKNYWTNFRRICVSEHYDEAVLAVAPTGNTST